MKDQGKLRRIRKLLGQGRTTAEVIGMGFAPGSVYKARRQLFGSKRTATSSAGPHDAGVAAMREQLEWFSERLEGAVGSVEDRTAAVAHHRDMMQWLQREHEQELRDAERERDAAKAQAEELDAEVARLKKLEEVWAGHPCRYCGEPVSDDVSREVAAQVTKRLAHQECIQAHRRIIDFGDPPIAASSARRG